MLTDHFILISPLFQRLRERARIEEGGKERKGRRDSDREAEGARDGGRGREGTEGRRMGGRDWDGGRDRQEASPELPAVKPKN
jgi:hypothetical protein